MFGTFLGLCNELEHVRRTPSAGTTSQVCRDYMDAYNKLSVLPLRRLLLEMGIFAAVHKTPHMEEFLRAQTNYIRTVNRCPTILNNDPCLVLQAIIVCPFREDAVRTILTHAMNSFAYATVVRARRP